MAATGQPTNGRATALLTTTSARGFRATTRMRLFVGPGPRPASAHERAHLRDGLPAVYREQDFAMRFVGALEEVLDPIVAILDSLPAYLIADYAPHDMLELLTAWLGLELDETQPHEHRRDLIRHAAELGRRRGTARGLELALRLAFPGVPLRVEDGGGVVWATESGSLPRIGPPEIVVYCDEPLPEERLTAMARFIERAKPVHVGYRLRVKTPKKPKGATKEEEAAPEPPPASGPEPPPASGAEPPTEGTPEAPEEPS